MTVDLTTIETVLANIRIDAENGSKLYQDPPGVVSLRNGDAVKNLRQRLVDVGYQPPVAFASGLSVTSTTFTVEYGNQVYAAREAAVPFTTTGTFNPSQWWLKGGAFLNTYTDTQFGVAADGVTDDGPAYALMAANLPAGATVVMSSGVSVIGQEVTFAQDGLKFIVSPGRTFQQKSGTLSLDRMFHFTGDYGYWEGGKFDQNLAGNPGTPTGRFEGVRWAGDYWTLRDITFEGSKDESYGTCALVSGSHCLMEDLTTFRSGRNAFRDWGDYNTWRRIRMLDCTAGPSNVCHAWTKDNAPGGNPFNLTVLDDIVVQSSTAYHFEGVLFDHDGVQGARASLRNVWIDAPNSTGPDCMKFVYVYRVDLDNVRIKPHTNASAAESASLRIQTAVDRLHLKDCVIAGGINFDADRDCALTLSGNTVLGNETVCTNLVEGFRGRFVAHDGVEFRKCGGYVVALDPTAAAWSSVVTFGRCGFHGYGATRLVNVNGPAGADPKRRIRAGMVTVGEPLYQDTVRTILDGSWITDGDNRDAACAQEGSRKFVAFRSDITPRDAEGWKLGDVIRDRVWYNYSQGYIRCISPGASCRTVWASGASVSLGAWRYYGANVYVAEGAGTTGGTPPTHTSGSVSDGAVTWTFVDALARWAGVFGSGVPEATAADIAGSGLVNQFDKFSGKVVRNSTTGQLMVASGSALADPWHQSEFIVTRVAATAIASASDAVNTSGKVAGKIVWDTTNNRMMVADGGGATARWYAVNDPTIYVTPA